MIPKISLTGYDAMGARRATAQEQDGYWTVHIFSGDGAAIVDASAPETLQEVVRRMKSQACTLFLGSPTTAQAKPFIERFSAVASQLPDD